VGTSLRAVLVAVHAAGCLLSAPASNLTAPFQALLRGAPEHATTYLPGLPQDEATEAGPAPVFRPPPCFPLGGVAALSTAPPR